MTEIHLDKQQMKDFNFPYMKGLYRQIKESGQPITFIFDNTNEEDYSIPNKRALEFMQDIMFYKCAQLMDILTITLMIRHEDEEQPNED